MTNENALCHIELPQPMWFNLQCRLWLLTNSHSYLHMLSICFGWYCWYPNMYQPHLGLPICLPHCFCSNPWALGRPTICCHISTWLRRPSKNALVAVASYKGAKTLAALICPRTFLSVHFTYLHILFLFPCFFWGELSTRSVMINKRLTWSMIANYSSIGKGLILEKLRNYPMMGKGLIAPLKKASDQEEKWDQVHLTCFQYSLIINNQHQVINFHAKLLKLWSQSCEMAFRTLLVASKVGRFINIAT